MNLIAFAGSNPALGRPSYGYPRIYIGLDPKRNRTFGKLATCAHCGTDVRVINPHPDWQILCPSCAGLRDDRMARAMLGLIRVVGTRFWRRPK